MESNKETTTFTDSIVFEIIKEFGERAKKGFDKYGTDMDRTDLTVEEWAQHLREELMDGLVYLTRLKKDIKLLQEQTAAGKSNSTENVRYGVLMHEVLSLTKEQFELFKKMHTQDEVMINKFNLNNSDYLKSFEMAIKSAKKLTEDEYHLADKIGMQIVYTIKSKPNETYTDEEPKIRKRYGFHR